MLDPPEPMRAVVADLGIGANELDQGRLTATHEIVGTPAFRAPESLTGQHSKRSDVYSIGKTIEAVLNRGGPLEVGPGKCLRDKRLTDELWDALDSMLARACAFDPDFRFESAAALLKAWPEGVLALDLTKTIRPPPEPPPTISLNVAETAHTF